MNIKVFLPLLLWMVISIACRGVENNNQSPEKMYERDFVPALADSLRSIISDAPGEIGVALIYQDSDTLLIDNTRKYPMMSVFKLHQAVATCDYLWRKGISVDSEITIPRRELNPNTWSPMLKDYKDSIIKVDIRTLLHYSIEQSDNNASNYLFDHFVSPEGVDKYVASLIPRESFRIKYSEEEMLSDHTLAYQNATTPLGAAELINKLYTESLSLPSAYRDLICNSLERCKTGKDRIAAPLLEEKGIKIAHKTGSGFRDNGVLAAHNDVAYIELPDGSHYSLAVFVKDFPCPDTLASEVIARISACVRRNLKPIH